MKLHLLSLVVIVGHLSLSSLSVFSHSLYSLLLAIHTMKTPTISTTSTAPIPKLCRYTNEGSVNDTRQSREFSEQLMKKDWSTWKTRERKYRDHPLNVFLKSFGAAAKNQDILLFQIWKTYCLEVNYQGDDDPDKFRVPFERTTYNGLLSYAIPSATVLNVITILVKKYAQGNMIDIGCGSGYWASLFIKQGLNVIAIDDKRENISFEPFFPQTIKMEANHYISEHKDWDHDSALFLCWPRPTLEMKQVLLAYSGPLVVFIGMLGEEVTLNVVEEMTSRPQKWIQVPLPNVKLPRWPLVQDDLYIWRRVCE